MPPSSHRYETMSDSVPVFLKKTYHMIDSCDTDIAGWDEDGLTFTVKDPLQFESTIIPQFFKHSKFTSFVRQLNFYSFRKIKCSDSIRIDLETEKRTANYWRFKHDNFQRGRADLLTEIKRMNGKAATASTSPTAVSAVAGVPTPLSAKNAMVPTTVTSSVTTVSTDKEVLKLKKRIDEMTKNMDKLTEMVEKVSLQQESTKNDCDERDEPGTKRKKHNVDDVMDYSIVPDVALSQFAMEELAAMPLSESPPSVPSSVPLSRESSDSEFVDQLFRAFEGDDEIPSDWISQPEDNASDGTGNDLNRPDPNLMKQLSDALSLLPRDVQEMIITRLITAITSPDGSFNVVPALVPPSETVEPMVVSSAAVKPTPEETPSAQPLPLAAATLAAMLHHYSNQVKEQQAASNAAQKAASKKTLKSLPVIPVHA